MHKVRPFISVYNHVVADKELLGNYSNKYTGDVYVNGSAGLKDLRK